MSDKKKATAGPKMEPENTIRCGNVIATIFRRQSNMGYSYRDFTLTRCWASQATGKELQGSSFFDTNEMAMIEATKAAAAWIREKNGSDADHGPEGSAINEATE